MRGFVVSGKPLSIGDAVLYIDRAPQVDVVLNSPFCLLRSLNKHDELHRFDCFPAAELAAHRTSLHRGSALPPANRNVVVITIESGNAIWYDGLCAAPNDDLRGFVPFLDSIASHSLVCPRLFATGVRSVEGLSAIFGGFPTFAPMSYVLSPYNGNTLDTPAHLLRRIGYSTVFYYGCNHGSYHLDQLAHAVGFERVVDRAAFGDDTAYDGHWGIFDHAMGAYAAEDLSRMKEPFFAGWFTLSPHAPFVAPEAWVPESFRNAEPSPQRSMAYTDRAIRHFFEKARRQPWFERTLFVITADHGCRDLRNTPYDTPYLKYQLPFILYAPDGSIAPGRIDDRVMAQFDIQPTLLGLLHYPHDYVALGTDLFADAEHYAISFADNQYRITGLRYAVLLSPDASRITAVYDIANDPCMTAPADRYDAAEAERMADWGRALLQDYVDRMIDDRLSLDRDRNRGDRGAQD